MTFVTALVAGLLFGLGLVISDMINPAVVIGFLDVGGEWNPALAFTMGGAIAIAAPAFFIARRRAFSGLPATRSIDAPLLFGSGIFGIGWGLSGICPGPGLILVTSGRTHAVVFILSLAVGVLAARRVRSRSG